MVAQLVERKLPKLEVAGSTPVRRLQRQSDIWLWGALFRLRRSGR